MTQWQQKSPSLSVVVATYARAETVRNVIHHLDHQELDANEYEVIVVSDHSPDHTAEVCREMAQTVPFDLHFLENEQNRGPGFTQNRGIRHARGGIILLMADDIMQSPGSLKVHLKFHLEHPSLEAAALGRVIQSPQLSHMSVFLKHWNPFRFDELEGADIIPVFRFGAANLSFKREFVTNHGMFHEGLARVGTVANEDLELGYRLKRHGLELHYLPNAWAHHFHVYTLDQAMARWYERGLNFAEFRKAAADPEVTVYFHDLRWKTLCEYAKVLRKPNTFQGREKSLAWHLFRESIRRLILNWLTVRLIWRPTLDRAEKWRWLGDQMNAQVYRAYLYYHFLRGVHSAQRFYGD